MRKVQLTGGSTLAISLPKEWARSLNVKDGDYLSIVTQPNGSLLISPIRHEESEEDAEKRVGEMRVSKEMSLQTAVRSFVAHYLAGHKTIRVVFGENTHEHRRLVKETISKKLVGVEIVEESANEMVVQCLASPAELPVKTAFRRMANIAAFMASDALACIKSPEKHLLSEIVERDDVVDRFYLFIVRQLKAAALGLLLPSEIGLSDMRECLGYRIAAKSVERIGDHAQRIAKSLMWLEKPLSDDVSNELLKMGNSILTLLNRSVVALLNSDAKTAHETIDEANRAKEIEDSIIKMLIEKRVSVNDALVARSVAESLKRIADYSADISEISINLSVKKPM